MQTNDVLSQIITQFAEHHHHFLFLSTHFCQFSLNCWKEKRAFFLTDVQSIDNHLLFNHLRFFCDTCDSKKCKTLVGARVRARERRIRNKN